MEPAEPCTISALFVFCIVFVVLTQWIEHLIITSQTFRQIYVTEKVDMNEKRVAA